MTHTSLKAVVAVPVEYAVELAAGPEPAFAFAFAVASAAGTASHLRLPE
jgi:hypothetical protein